jgi:hypothetical protein
VSEIVRKKIIQKKGELTMETNNETQGAPMLRSGGNAHHWLS